MTTYNELAGLKVNYLGSDPTLNSGNEGQVWYNSATGTLKSLVQLKAWSAAANLPVAKNEAGSDGTSTAGWTAGGSTGPAANTGTTATEEYSGYTWASGGNLNTARTLTGGSGFGTQTAAAVAGGATQPGAGPTRTTLTATEEYNGTSWTSVTGLPTATFAAAQCGIQTAGLSFAGTAGYGNPNFNTSLEYDGTNWTSGGNLNNAVIYQAAGIQTAALGMQTSDTAGKGTESYNGTTWSTVANRNTARAQIVGFGTQALATLAGGYNAGPGTPQLTETEQWDGTAWGISTASLGTATRTGMGIGTVGGGTSGLLAGGYQTDYIANTQEFNSTIFSPATGAWASGGNLNTARFSFAGSGTQTSALVFSGTTGSGTPGNIPGATEKYDGTSWTNTGTMNTGRFGVAGAGTQTATIASGGGTNGGNPNSPSSASESFNGSTWTNTPSINTARRNATGAGILTAAIIVGGQRDGSSPDKSAATEFWNGTSWTSVNSLNTAKRNVGAAGTQTAAIAFGGTTATDITAVTESWDGTSWTNLPAGNMNTTRTYLAGCGTQTAAVAFGGYTPTTVGNTEIWDGTLWTSVPPMSSARYDYAAAGTQTSGLAAGGTNPTVATTEEWSGPQTTATASTLTTS